MSGMGSDPDNRPDGFTYNLFPVSPRAGLFGGQYADMMANASRAGGSPSAPASLYDMLHRGLNTPFGSDALQIAHGLAQGMEKYGPYAEGLGIAGVAGGVMTGNLPFAAGSAGLAALASGMDKLGHGLDAGTSFLKSIQQDNSQPLEDFRQRMETPGFYGLQFPGLSG